MMKRLGLTIAAVILTILIMPASAALADQANPDSTPTITMQSMTVQCFRNVLETGDFLMWIPLNTPYASPPASSFSQSFTARLLNSTGTELGSTIGYSYHDNGYGYNLISMYWSAADAPAWNPATPYTLRLAGNPAVFASPPIYNYTIESSMYSTITNQTDAQTAITTLTIATATTLNQLWGFSTTNSLTEAGDTGTVLSLYGQMFFRGAVYGIQAMAPNAFDIAYTPTDTTQRTWSTGYSENLTTLGAGTWIERAKQGGETLFGTVWDFASVLLVLFLCAAAYFGHIKVGPGDQWGAFALLCFVALILGRMGLYAASFLALAAAGFWMWTSGKLWGIFQ